MSTILKVRSVLMITLNILIVFIFCVARQMLLNEASFNRRNCWKYANSHQAICLKMPEQRQFVMTKVVLITKS
jgi:hypothetical protein